MLSQLAQPCLVSLSCGNARTMMHHGNDGGSPNANKPYGMSFYCHEVAEHYTSWQFWPIMGIREELAFTHFPNVGTIQFHDET
jgi:hypothetical protein